MEAVVLGDGGPDHQAVLDALLSAGIDRSLVDRDGVTPRQHAEAHGLTAMLERQKRSNRPHLTREQSERVAGVR